MAINNYRLMYPQHSTTDSEASETLDISKFVPATEVDKILFNGMTREKK